MTQEFKAYKFHIANEDQSKRLQEVLFKLGYSWFSDVDDSVVRNTDATFLYTNLEKFITYGYINSKCSRLEQDTEEFIKMHTKDVLKKHKWYDVIVAAAEGKTVQHRSNAQDKWYDYEGAKAFRSLAWQQDNSDEYRIKPEPVEVWRWAYSVDKVHIKVTPLHYATEDDAKEYAEMQAVLSVDWITKIEPTKKLVEV